MRPKIDWLGGRLTLQMIPHLMFRTFFCFCLCFSCNAVLSHFNLRGLYVWSDSLQVYNPIKCCTSWSTNLQPADGGGTNQNISGCIVELKWKSASCESWRHTMPRMSARIVESFFCSILLEEMSAALWASLKERRSFLFVIVSFCWFLSFLCPSISQIFKDTLSCLSIHYIQIIY